MERLETKFAYGSRLGTEVLCGGYVRREIGDKHDPSHIASILFEYLFIDWKWEYLFKEIENTKENHQITNNDKTFECKKGGYGCDCFGRCNFPMIPNSGVYKMKIKINKIFNCGVNSIGITINNDKNNNGKDAESNRNRWFASNDYIAWTAFDELPANFQNYARYNLLCGWTQHQETNVFYKNGFKYESNNKNNGDSLPNIHDNDVLILTYDSNQHELTFNKENDKECDCKISNLPKNETCYWFVGHTYGAMSVTILAP